MWNTKALATIVLSDNTSHVTPHRNSAAAVSINMNQGILQEDFGSVIQIAVGEVTFQTA